MSKEPPDNSIYPFGRKPKRSKVPNGITSSQPLKGRTAELVLFPLCDSRGLVIRSLNSTRNNAEAYKAENIFFAWLLDLPKGIDAAAAAAAVLVVGNRTSAGLPLSRVSEKSRSTLIELNRDRLTEEQKAFRSRMVELLSQVASKGTLHVPVNVPATEPEGRLDTSWPPALH